MIDVPVLLDDYAMIPVYATDGASGADLFAAIDEPVTLAFGERKLIPTGISVQIPEGYEIQIRSRSGLALKHGIIVLNAPGTIDCDYRGKIGVILLNTAQESFTIQPNDRIAQAVMSPYVKMNFVNHNQLNQTVRGDGGFGHTGLQKEC